MDIGPMEWLVILVVAFLLFGPKRIEEVFRSLGKGVRAFKQGAQGLDDDGKKPNDDAHKSNPSA